MPILGVTPDPTVENIDKVKKNLRNMQAFNDYIYNNGGVFISNAYLLLTSTDNSDPGLTVGISLLEGAFGIVGSCGAFGGFACAFMCSEVASWTSVTPPDLNATFASMAIRYQHSSMAFDSKCSEYINDPAGNWNKVFTWQGTSIVLGDLATIDFPVQGDPDFYPMAAASLRALDITVWQTVLRAQCYVTQWTYNSGPRMQKADTDMTRWDEDFISRNPAWYNTWYWHSKKGLFDKDWWYVNEYNLNFGATHMNTKDIPKDACTYLFIDSADGVVINNQGLAARKDVFEKWGIRRTIVDDNSSF